MTSSQEHSQTKDEISLIELVIQLWNKKYTILLISTLCGCLGLVYTLISPGKYVGEFVLRGPAGVSLASYANLNDSIKEHYGKFLQGEANGKFLQREAKGRVDSSQFEIKTDGLVADMTRKLQEFEEYEVALKMHSMKASALSEDEFFDARTTYFSKLRVIVATDRNPETRIILNWPNEQELIKILKTTLFKAEENLISDKLVLLNSLADNVERRTERKLKTLARDQVSMKETIDLEIEGRLAFLKEQAQIARELDLAENSLSDSRQESRFFFEMSSENNSAYSAPPEAVYLQGYKSLEKEIELLTSRVGEKKYLMSSQFMYISKQIIEHKNSVSADLFREAIQSSPFAINAGIFSISEDAIRIENSRNTILILGIFLVFGFFGSCLFVLMREAFGDYRKK